MFFLKQFLIIFDEGKTFFSIFFNDVRKEGSYFPWYGVNLILCVSRKGVSSWKKRYSRGLRVRRKDIEWSNWPNSTTSRFTQVFDHDHSIFPPSLLSSFVFFFLFQTHTFIVYVIGKRVLPNLQGLRIDIESRTCDFEHANWKHFNFERIV